MELAISIAIYVLVVILLLALLKRFNVISEDNVFMAVLWPCTIILFVGFVIATSPIFIVGYLVEYITERLKNENV